VDIIENGNGGNTVATDFLQRPVHNSNSNTAVTKTLRIQRVLQSEWLVSVNNVMAATEFIRNKIQHLNRIIDKDVTCSMTAP